MKGVNIMFNLEMAECVTIIEPPPTNEVRYASATKTIVFVDGEAL